MICLKHYSTVLLIYMSTILQSATLLTIWRHPANAVSEGLQKDIDEASCYACYRKRLVKKLEHSSLQLRLKFSELNHVHSHKLLGLTIGSLISFDQHVDGLCKKLAQRIAVLRQIRRSLPLDQKKRYYNASTKAKVYASTV